MKLYGRKTAGWKWYFLKSCEQFSHIQQRTTNIHFHCGMCFSNCWGSFPQPFTPPIHTYMLFRVGIPKSYLYPSRKEGCVCVCTQAFPPHLKPYPVKNKSHLGLSVSFSGLLFTYVPHFLFLHSVSIYLSINQSIYLSIIYLSIIQLSTHPSIHLHFAFWLNVCHWKM